MKKGMLCLIGAFYLTGVGCTLNGENLFAGDETGRFLLSSDAEGMRAFGEAMNGLVVTGKSAPNEEDSYWTTQKHRIELKRFKVQPPKGAQK